jgi:hypothetical protein
MLSQLPCICRRVLCENHPKNLIGDILPRVVVVNEPNLLESRMEESSAKCSVDIVSYTVEPGGEIKCFGRNS